MLLKFKNLNTSDKLLLSVFSFLIVGLVSSAIYYLPKKSNNNQNIQSTSSTTSNQLDSNNISNQVKPSSNSTCHINGSLPDPVCTPGSIDPRVNQENIQQTICVSGYTKSVRPSSTITSKMKLVSMKEYGFTDSASNYEYDHLISLELGGAPQDTKNLWPEPGASPNPKDKIENKLHSLICSGAISLSEAQRRISTDWTTALNGF